MLFYSIVQALYLGIFIALIRFQVSLVVSFCLNYVCTLLEIGGIADWCQIENGGCDQICVNHCNRKTTCKCYEGYTLAYDQKTCVGKCKI